MPNTVLGGLRATFLALLACTAAAPAALAQAPQNASLYVVHGIPGRDVAPTLDPQLPVDVKVDGICLLPGLNFGAIVGPFDVPPGTYKIVVSLANPIAPCMGTPVITASPTVKAGEVGAIVAALTTKGAPTAEVYGIDLSPVPAGMQRFVVAHAADAPPVKVTATSTGGGATESASFLLSPTIEKSLTVPARTSFSLTAAAPGKVIGPVFVRPGNKAVTVAFAVGSAATGSATILTKVIDNVE